MGVEWYKRATGPKQDASCVSVAAGQDSHLRNLQHSGHHGYESYSTSGWDAISEIAKQFLITP